MIIHKLRKVGATKRRRSNSSCSSTNFRWLWFVIGLAGGLLFASLLISISNGDFFKITKKKNNLLTKTTHIKKTALEHAKVDKPSTTYDFYKLLPQQAPEYQNKVSNAKKSLPTTPITTTKNEPSEKQNEKQKIFVLHVGEFETLELADQAKAKLALHGINSTIETLSLSPTKYRVIIIASKNKNQVVQKQLALTKINIMQTFLITR